MPQRKPDMAVFTSAEVATIDAVLAQLAGLTGAQVSGLSHAEPGWKLTELHETIPYASALLCAGQVSTPTSRRLSRAAAATHGIELE